ncbi:hypothetical protein OS189_14345 [Sulfitobacter sp. F26169L]|uniref:hypothetical protein n=1 Tax=Sulfitobacter sp. F26169L TaxID=2996015 RepID=UPI002261016B|nr:hypothetical protein [Sulfitobacter sp. F26169L]MCX7567524.1 hypothetical protein [Sulfitobacter sp. F26169L]
MSHQILVPAEVLEQVLSDAKTRRFVAVAQDALWRNKYSSVFEYPADEKQQIADQSEDE